LEGPRPAASGKGLDGAWHSAGGAGGDDAADVAVQSRGGDCGEELGISSGEALLVQRFRGVPGDGSQQSVGAGALDARSHDTRLAPVRRTGWAGCQAGTFSYRKGRRPPGSSNRG